MADLVVIVPSRGRPEAARALSRVFTDTCTAATDLVFAVDADDPTADEYQDAGVRWVAPAPSNMVTTLNLAASAITALADDGSEPPFAVGFMGDDHCPRTYGWDERYLEALHELGTGIVYGDDLLQGERLATQCAMTADIVRALGYMAPPTLTHLYVDNFWMSLGQAAGGLRYLPGVIVEHRHPVAGKAAWDENYARVNNSAMYDRDQKAFAEYLQAGFEADVLKVRALRG